MAIEWMIYYIFAINCSREKALGEDKVLNLFSKHMIGEGKMLYIK